MKRYFKNIPLIVIFVAYLVINAFLFIMVDSNCPEQLKNGTFWFVWAMSFIVSYGLNILIVYLADGKSNTSFLTDFPLYVLMFAGSIVYAVSGIVMALSPELEFKYALLIEVIILAVYIIALLLLYRMAKYIGANNMHQAKKVASIRNLVADVDFIISCVADTELKSKLKNLSELIRFSDPMSNDSVKDIEMKIELAIFKMREDAMNNNTADLPKLIDETSNLVKYRNSKVKLSK